MRGTDDQPRPLGLPPTRSAAVSTLFHLHCRRLVGLAGLLVEDRETAEEVVQDAFESLYRHWGSLRDPSSAVAYLDRCVVYGSRTKARRRSTERAYVWPEAGTERSAEAVGVASGARDDLIAAVRQLPQRQREVIVLRYFLDLSEDQIAQWLGVSAGSVKKHSSRATAALHRRMGAWA